MKKGFTLIELLVVIGIIGILAAVVIAAVNPARQFASARDTQRKGDLIGLTTAIYSYATEHNGQFPSVITTTPTKIGTGVGLINLTPVLVPMYLSAIPKDPTTGADTDTRYMIWLDVNSRINASAASELTPAVPIKILR